MTHHDIKTKNFKNFPLLPILNFLLAATNILCLGLTFQQMQRYFTNS